MKKVFNFIFIFLLTIILFASNKVHAEERWIGECYYGQETGNLNYNVSFKFNRYNIDVDVENVQFSKIDFELEDVLNYYDTYGKCPEKLYRNDIPGDPNPNSSPLKYISVTGSGYSIIKNYKNIINKENDGLLTTDDKDVDFYSKCYYRISGTSSGIYTVNGVININFNKDNYDYKILDNNLESVVTGITFYDSQGASLVEKVTGDDINLNDLHYYYENNSNGCPPRVYLDKNGALYLPKHTENHKEKYTFDYSNESTSKNKELNLDGSKITSSNASLPNITTCTGLLGEPDDEGSPAYYLVKAFDVIKYVAIVLLIVLSVMDFTGAVTKQDKDALSKILKKVMMRFILCIIIFFLPYFVKLLLHYLVERQIDLCGIGG